MDYQRIMIFGAHPDDELSMAATIRKLADRGVEISLVTMTDGREGYPRQEWKEQIVEMRRREATEADKVLGVTRRYFLGRPDMGLTADKDAVRDCVQVVRRVRPEAIFTQGPHDRHRDHLATHTISVQAAWHAGEPVSADLGQPWRTPHLYYYKSCRLPLPTVVIDTTGYAHILPEARATQVSQHTLFGRTKEQFLADAQRLREELPHTSDRFWIVETNELSDFLPLRK